MTTGIFHPGPALKRLILLASFGLSTSLHGSSGLIEGPHPPAQAAIPSPSSLSQPSEAFTREIGKRMHRIEEFKVLREWGIRNKLRIWAAGGTATGLAVYIKHHIENETLKQQGKPLKYFDGRFSYNYFDVYRSTQDADLVIDGKEEDARKLESYLRENFNYLAGSKEIWEVRLLRHRRGSAEAEKDALLGFDFQNQNSDSFSTGMVELTYPPKGETRVRDLFQWNEQEAPRFLRDLLESKVTFYRNPKHSETKRAKAGMNPEILSVIRVLTKALQYESFLRADHESEILKIIDAWDPTEDVSSYVASQISKNGQKLFWHSPDVERAWDETERLGLRRKLIQFGEKHEKSDLVVCLSRRPLRTRPLGTTGKTARELGLSIVAHETETYLAYENISRSLHGKANVFISRRNVDTEEAAHGDGFYTRVGNQGARGTGLTVRFRLHPDSREGADFTRHDDFVVVTNASALQVVDESLNLTPTDFFNLALTRQFSRHDRGILERLRLKLNSSGIFRNEAESRFIRQLFDVDTTASPRAMSRLILEFVVSHPRGLQSDLHDRCTQWLNESFSENPVKVIREILNNPKIADQPMTRDLVHRVISGGSPNQIAQLLSLERIRVFTEFETWVETLLESHPNLVAAEVLTRPHLKGHSKYVTWIDRAVTLKSKTVFMMTLKSSELGRSPEYANWVEQGLRTNLEQVIEHLLPQPWLKSHPSYPDWLSYALERNPEHVIRQVLSSPAIMKHRKFGEWIKRANELRSDDVIRHVLHSPELMRHPDFDDWVERAIEKNVVLVSSQVLGGEHLHTHPKISDWILKAISRHPGALHPNELFDHTIHELIRKGKGEAFLHLCPVGTITAPRLRRILMDQPTGWDRCAMLLRPLMKAVR